MAALHRALDRGVNFFDTADVYGDGRSERLLARLRKERKEPFYITTKAGRRLPKQTVEGYNKKNIGAFVDRSLKNLAVDTIDLLQIHCPPTDAFYHPEVFELFDDLVKAGKIRFYGVSVERVEEALKALDYPGVQSVQLVYNIFRQRPADLFLSEARRRKVGVLARLPLSSGMLAGKMTRASKLPAPFSVSVIHSAKARRRYDVRQPDGGCVCQRLAASTLGISTCRKLCVAVPSLLAGSPRRRKSVSGKKSSP